MGLQSDPQVSAITYWEHMSGGLDRVIAQTLFKVEG